MFSWLQTIDRSLFHFVNQTLRHPWLDRVMPFFNGNVLFLPAVLIIAALVIWKGGRRARICLLLVVLTLAIGDGCIVSFLKAIIKRPRPYLVIPEMHLLVGKGGPFGFPSAHAANWFSVATVLFFFYRRSCCYMLPLAVLVSYSRIYVGVHYPSDVLGGALIGMICVSCIVFMADALWKTLAKRSFPYWWRTQPVPLQLRGLRMTNQMKLENEQE